MDGNASRLDKQACFASSDKLSWVFVTAIDCAAIASAAMRAATTRGSRRARLPKLLLVTSCATALVLPARTPTRRPTALRAAVLDPLNAEDLGDSATVPELAEAVAHKGAADVTALSLLEEIRSLKFFSLYSIDLLANCAYLGGAPEECEFDACEVFIAASRRVEAPSRRRRDSWPSHDDVGGFFSDFEPIRRSYRSTPYLYI